MLNDGNAAAQGNNCPPPNNEANNSAIGGSSDNCSGHGNLQKGNCNHQGDHHSGPFVEQEPSLQGTSSIIQVKEHLTSSFIKCMKLSNSVGAMFLKYKSDFTEGI